MPNEALKHRYVLQEHFTEPHHYDFMVEHDGKLLTWSFEDLTALQNENIVVAKKIFDHRLKYLDYEGEITGKGRVQIVTAGHCHYQTLNNNSTHLHIIDGNLAGNLKIDLSNDQWSMQLQK